MTGRSAALRRRFGLLLIAAAVCAPLDGSAHRLDEYFQSAQILVEPTRVTLDLYLSPGIEIVPSVVAAVDTDRNNAISDAEARAFAGKVLAATTLALDGRRVTPALVTISFPTMEEFRDGVGSVHVQAATERPRPADGRHTVAFSNRFEPRISDYAANAVLPLTAEVAITKQSRDELQQHITIAYDLRPKGPKP